MAHGGGGNHTSRGSARPTTAQGLPSSHWLQAGWQITDSQAAKGKVTPWADAHVVLILHAGGLAARAQHHISHALQRALQLHLLQVLAQGRGQQGHHHLQGAAISARSHLGMQGQHVAGCCKEADRSAAADCRAAAGVAGRAGRIPAVLHLPAGSPLSAGGSLSAPPLRQSCRTSPRQGTCGKGQSGAGDSSHMRTRRAAAGLNKGLRRAGATTIAKKYRNSHFGTALALANRIALKPEPPGCLALQWWPKSDRCHPSFKGGTPTKLAGCW